jgi:hypothetical protein
MNDTSTTTAPAAAVEAPAASPQPALPPGEPRGRTLRIERNGQVYFQRMLPNGDLFIRHSRARRGVTLTADEVYKTARRLMDGSLLFDL